VVGGEKGGAIEKGRLHVYEYFNRIGVSIRKITILTVFTVQGGTERGRRRTWSQRFQKRSRR